MPLAQEIVVESYRTLPIDEQNPALVTQVVALTATTAPLDTATWLATLPASPQRAAGFAALAARWAESQPAAALAS